MTLFFLLAESQKLENQMLTILVLTDRVNLRFASHFICLCLMRCNCFGMEALRDWPGTH